MKDDLILGEEISPNFCLVEGTIVEIRQSSKKIKNGCDEISNEVLFQVNNIIECGSSIVNKPSILDTIVVYFPHSIAPNKKCNPNLNDYSKPLKLNDVLTANIEVSEEMGGTFKYVVYDYRIK